MRTRTKGLAVVGFVLGWLARDLVVPAHAQDELVRRADVLAVVRALEGQARSLDAQAQAAHAQARATEQVRDAVREASRACGR